MTVYVIRDSEGVIIGSSAFPQDRENPEIADENNPDWVQYLSPKPEDVEGQVKLHVSSVAVDKGYDSPETLQSYVNSTNPLWRAEANAFVAWRDGVWAYVYEQIALWENEERTIDTADELVVELDDIVWPTEDDYVPALIRQDVLSSMKIIAGLATNINSNSGIAGAWRQETGIYWLFFTAPQSDLNYIVNSYDGGTVTVHAPEGEKALEYCLVYVRDGAGDFVDPDQINIEVKRAT